MASAARRSRTADISGPLTTHEWPLRSHLVRRKFAAVHLSHPAELKAKRRKRDPDIYPSIVTADPRTDWSGPRKSAPARARSSWRHSIPRLSRGRRRSLAAADGHRPMLTCGNVLPRCAEGGPDSTDVLRSVVRFHLAPPAERAYQQVNCHFEVDCR